LQKSKSLGRCTVPEAKARRDELALSIRRGEFVQPSKQTLAQSLNVWLDESVRSARRGNTVLSYQSLIANHIIPALGGVQLQALRSGHLSKYYAEKARAGLSSGTLGVHHAVLSSALSSAVKQGLVTRNVAVLVDAKPKARTAREQAKQHCWSAEEARSFLRQRRTWDHSSPRCSASHWTPVRAGVNSSAPAGRTWTSTRARWVVV